ncbi:MATE family efflux transporter [Paenibacillus allorhizosphaerae]|uniref:Probable multidrug resistance protein NorM n=1 Tax=Paenibacillus allorhizosphaerae TaxID=2849866 RepID=A0ABN7TP22_9BACL|nr:MATE family efflux transporter [Paenibacillus allorhizosphaerae]CAG7649324.1 Multidrug resistance protein NorM [Paenibacillus allorhizosphaerae]
MIQTHSLLQKTRQFIVILLPIMITQLTMFAMTFFDTFMSGHAGAVDLAGVAIGSSIWVPVQTGLNGIMFAITPIVAQLVGAGRNEKVPFTVIQGIYLAAALALAVIACGAFALNPMLQAMNLEPAVRSTARGFLIAISAGTIPLFIYTVLRSFMDALGQTRMTMAITLLSLPINVLLNYLFIFGNMGFPRLGGIGAGVASAITYWCICAIAFFVMIRKQPFASYRITNKWFGLSFKAWKEQLQIGVPIGFAIFFETSIFAAVTLLMSEYDTITIAAHQAALNFASFLYMIPLSISMALTILVSFEAGAARYRDARQYGYLGIGFAIGLSLLCALLLLVLNEQIASIYTKEAAVAVLAQQFLMYAIFFQLSDAIAAPIQGALRGYKDVNITLIVALISYWVLGLPIGYVLAHYTSMGAFGYWVGLIAGLASGAVGLFMRLLHVQRVRSRAVRQPGHP